MTLQFTIQFSFYLVVNLTEEEQLAEQQKLYAAIGYSESESTVKLPVEVRGRLQRQGGREGGREEGISERDKIHYILKGK